MKRHAKGHADANQPDIVAALRKCGATVELLTAVGGGVPDLLVGWRGRNLLLEVKDGSLVPSAQKLRPSQVAFISSWRGEVRVVRSVDEALAAIGVKP